MNPIELPDFALIVLIGASGSGKSTFARTHFRDTEILSSDYFRALVSDDETDQGATTDAFDALHHLAAIRLRRRKSVVIDATNVQAAARKPLLDLARRYYAVPTAIVLNVPEAVCAARNEARPNRDFGKHVVARHVKELNRSVKGLRKEGFRYVYHLEGEAAISSAQITRTPLWPDKRTEMGPFDIIGDIHGCYDELVELLQALGYVLDEQSVWRHPAGRRLVFVGDLVDRGPKVVESASLVMDAVANGAALCVPGNHDDKLKRALEGRKVQITHGVQESLNQIDALPEADRESFKARYIAFVDSLISHLWLDGGKLAVAHAGIRSDMIGRASGAIREFCLYGDATGETDERGLPIRRDWAIEYKGDTFVAYGHTPVAAVRFVNNTANLDTGSVFGGSLSALRWPEREVVSVKAHRTYAESQWGIAPEAGTIEESTSSDALPNLADCLGRRTVSTRLAGNVLIAEGNSAAALEVMSRFAAHPRWLVYLPPTMSPVETASAEGYLEHPAEAFAYFARHKIDTVVCQEKHMGSRAVLVICKNEDAAQRHFGALPGEVPGAVLTRTGRPFSNDPLITRGLLDEASRAIQATGLWEELQTDWLVLDAELMPWNAKAEGLLKEQYAPVAAAGRVALMAEVTALEAAANRGVPGTAERAEQARRRLADIEAYRIAYGRYCKTVNGIEDLSIAPFHLLAAEGRTFTDWQHPRHIATLARLAEVSPLFVATPTQLVETGNPDSVVAGIAWWTERTEAGGEGMVVKPLTFLPPKGCQPAVKVRGREYLRIIYGPEYTEPENLTRLRQRSLNAKRSLATREFALGIEGLERFVAGDSLPRVHECAFAVLALESEPVDPRL